MVKSKHPPKQRKRSFVPREAAALVRRAKAGDTDAALTVLERYCEAEERGDNVPPEILGWIRKAFRTVLRGNASNLNKLLRLPAPAANRPVNVALPARDRKIQRRVNTLRRTGSTRKAAIFTAVDEFHLSASAIDKIMKDYLSLLSAAKKRHDECRSDTNHAKEMLFPKEAKVINEE